MPSLCVAVSASSHCPAWDLTRPQWLAPSRFCARSRRQRHPRRECEFRELGRGESSAGGRDVPKPGPRGPGDGPAFQQQEEEAALSPHLCSEPVPGERGRSAGAGAPRRTPVPKSAAQRSSVSAPQSSPGQTPQRYPTEWLVYDEMSRGHRMVVIRCCSLVTPLAAAIFAGGAKLPFPALENPAEHRQSARGKSVALRCSAHRPW